MSMIEIKNLTKQYKAGKPVISNINESFNRGEFIGIVGPNGSGKTTFLRLLSVNSFPTSGTVLCNGNPIYEDPQSYLAHVGLVHDQESLPLHLSAEELLEWVLRSRNMWDDRSPARISNMLDRLALGEDRQEQIGTYSTGMKKKTQVAAALIVQPDVLILDEPLRGLDTSAREQVLEMLIEAKEGGSLILMASHTADSSAGFIDRVLTFPLQSGKQTKMESVD